MSKITRSAISRKPIDQNKNKKIRVLENIFLHLYILVLDLKIKIQMAKNRCLTFWTSVKSTLNGPTKRPSGDILKNPK